MIFEEQNRKRNRNEAGGKVSYTLVEALRKVRSLTAALSSAKQGRPRATNLFLVRPVVNVMLMVKLVPMHI